MMCPQVRVHGAQLRRGGLPGRVKTGGHSGVMKTKEFVLSKIYIWWILRMELWVLQFPRNKDVSVPGCLSPCVRVVACPVLLSPNISWEWLQPPAVLVQITRHGNKIWIHPFIKASLSVSLSEDSYSVIDYALRDQIWVGSCQPDDLNLPTVRSPTSMLSSRQPGANHLFRLHFRSNHSGEKVPMILGTELLWVRVL